MKLIKLLICVVLTTMTAQPALSANPIFRTTLPNAIESLDPATFTSSESRAVGNLIYNQLVTYRPFNGVNGSGSLIEIIPDLAESWDVSPDQTVYTFKIRKNLKFHNGDPVTASDVRYSIERIAHPGVGSEGVWAIEKMGIKGYSDYIDNAEVLPEEGSIPGIDRTIHMSGMEVLDDHLLLIRLEKPLPYFLDLLTLPYFSIVSQKAVIRWGERYSEHPVGTGNYKLLTWSKNAPRPVIRLKRFSDNNINSLTTNIAEIRFFVVGDPVQEHRFFRQRKLEHAPIPMSVSSPVLNDPVWNPPGERILREVKSFNNLHESKVIKQPQWDSVYLSMNTQEFPFNNKKFRQGLNFALNKQRMVNEALAGYGTKAKGILPNEFPGFAHSLTRYNHKPTCQPYDPDSEPGKIYEKHTATKAPLRFPDFSRARSPYVYNPDLARHLFFEAGWTDRDSDGTLEPPDRYSAPLFLRCETDTKFDALCKSIQLDLKAVGLDVRLDDPTEIYDDAIVENFILTMQTWKPKLADAEFVFRPLFYTDSEDNISQYSNERVDCLIDKADEELEKDYRYSLFQHVENVVLEDAPWVFLLHPVEYRIVQPYVTRYSTHPLLPFPYQLFDLAPNLSHRP